MLYFVLFSIINLVKTIRRGKVNMEVQDGKIIERDIENEMKTSYIDYAMSVIVSRALPDVRDGLKPVHRRICMRCMKMELLQTSHTEKCANTVGSVLGRYHPHGDSSVYDAMVRMAQEFSLRYPLIDGHGNFGSIDGDGAAAMRYTEARMAKIAEQMLVDIEKIQLILCQTMMTVCKNQRYYQPKFQPC